jgi:hypothetical protein
VPDLSDFILAAEASGDGGRVSLDPRYPPFARAFGATARRAQVGAVAPAGPIFTPRAADASGPAAGRPEAPAHRAVAAAPRPARPRLSLHPARAGRAPMLRLNASDPRMIRPREPRP